MQNHDTNQRPLFPLHGDNFDTVAVLPTSDSLKALEDADALLDCHLMLEAFKKTVQVQESTDE
jgi:hypothetical protein